MGKILARQAILKAAKHEVGVREHGANNHGPRVEQYQTHDSIPGGGYAWCNDFVNFCMDVSGCHSISEKLGESASVDITFHTAVNLGWDRQNNVVPKPGWLVVYTFSHIGIVVADIGGGEIETYEGNTGSSGAVSDSTQGGDGVYEKQRSKYLVHGWVAIPEIEIDDAMINRFVADKDPRLVAHTNDEAYWLWLRWRLGREEFKRWGPANIAHRPNGKLPKVGDPIFSTWEPRMHRFVAAERGK